MAYRVAIQAADGTRRTIPCLYVPGCAPELDQAITYFLAVCGNAQANARHARAFLIRGRSYTAGVGHAMWRLERVTS
jgi:hypothetical protein